MLFFLLFMAALNCTYSLDTRIYLIPTIQRDYVDAACVIHELLFGKSLEMEQGDDDSFRPHHSMKSVCVLVHVCM